MNVLQLFVFSFCVLLSSKVFSDMNKDFKLAGTYHSAKRQRVQDVLLWPLYLTDCFDFLDVWVLCAGCNSKPCVLTWNQQQQLFVFPRVP